MKVIMNIFLTLLKTGLEKENIELPNEPYANLVLFLLRLAFSVFASI
jgi:hypothetical protein